MRSNFTPKYVTAFLGMTSLLLTAMFGLSLNSRVSGVKWMVSHFDGLIVSFQWSLQFEMSLIRCCVLLVAVAVELLQCQTAMSSAYAATFSELKVSGRSRCRCCRESEKALRLGALRIGSSAPWRGWSRFSLGFGDSEGKL